MQVRLTCYGQVGETIRFSEQAAGRADKNSSFFVYFNLAHVYDSIRDRVKVDTSVQRTLAALKCRRTGIPADSSPRIQQVNAARWYELYLRQAVESDPKHAVARHQYGAALSRLGRFEDAIRVFDDLIRDELRREGGPTVTLLYAHRAKIINLNKVGGTQQAVLVRQAAFKEIEPWPWLFNRAYELDAAS